MITNEKLKRMTDLRIGYIEPELLQLVELCQHVQVGYRLPANTSIESIQYDDNHATLYTYCFQPY